VVIFGKSNFMLRKATTNDLEFIYNLYMHPDINPWLLYEPMDIETFEPIYKDLLDKQVKYVYEHEREEMGMCKLVPLTHRTSHVVYLGGLGIHPGFAGKGHGAKMLREITDLCRTAGYKRIELSVSVRNEKAIHLYDKVGFEKEGVLRKYTRYEKDNEFVDEILMSSLL
jgi:L-phenylalanine/L-methionine N-acetyltransferase